MRLGKEDFQTRYESTQDTDILVMLPTLAKYRDFIISCKVYNLLDYKMGELYCQKDDEQYFINQEYTCLVLKDKKVTLTTTQAYTNKTHYKITDYLMMMSAKEVKDFNDSVDKYINSKKRLFEIKQKAFNNPDKRLEAGIKVYDCVEFAESIFDVSRKVSEWGLNENYEQMFKSPEYRKIERLYKYIQLEEDILSDEYMINLINR